MKSNAFQYAILAAFIVLALIGVALFASQRSAQNQPQGTVTIWGPYDRVSMTTILDSVDFSGLVPVNIEYEEVRPEEFDNRLLEALARDTNPDLVILPQDKLFVHLPSMFVIPYESYSERVFKDTFVRASEVFLTPLGVAALPLTIDPLVMYWNRDMFANALRTNPIRYWEEVATLVDDFVEIEDGVITQSAVALGEYRNINNATEILSLLIMQAGNPITRWQDNELESVAAQAFNLSVPPAQAALIFYTDYANPSKTVYSWNRSLKDARDAFIAEDLAVYFGFASELPRIQQGNPNLDFDVAEIPQVPGTDRMTYADVMGLAVLSKSRNPEGAFNALFALTRPNTASRISQLTSSSPVHKSVLDGEGGGAFDPVFDTAAITARTWLSPTKEEINPLFQNMIENVTSGSLRVSEAVSEFDRQLDNLVQF